MNLQKSLLEDLDNIYQSLAQPERFYESSNIIAKRLDAHAVSFFSGSALKEEMHQVMYSSQASQEDIAFYMKNYAEEDRLLRSHVMSIPKSQAYTTTDILPISLLKEQKVFVEYFEPKGFYYVLGADIDRSESDRQFMMFNRPGDMPDFGACEKAYLQTLLPHLKNIKLINQQLRHAQINQQSMFDYFQHTDAPTIALTLDLRVTYCNAAAELLINSKVATIKNSHLFLHDYQVQKQLFSTLHSFSSDLPDYPRNHLLSYGAYEIKVLLLNSNVHGEQRLGQKVAVLVFESAENQAQKIARLSKQYGLTTKETQLVACLVKGLTLKLASEAMSASINTVRFHLKNIFTKTDTHAQKELVLLFIKQ